MAPDRGSRVLILSTRLFLPGDARLFRPTTDPMEADRRGYVAGGERGSPWLGLLLHQSSTGFVSSRGEGICDAKNKSSWNVIY